MAHLHNTTRPNATPDFANTVLFLANRAVASVSAWQFRARSRRHLALMDDHQLRDIGLDRTTRDLEVGKPFWRD